MKTPTHYVIKVTAHKMVCVKADSEEDATDYARENVELGWDVDDTEVEDEYDEADATHARFIAEYDSEGELYDANPSD